MAGAAGVGGHLGVTADGDRVVTHRFACLEPAYRGWCWAVTVARASRAKNVTVDESLLLPGPDAILAPDWVPWRERLLPGDLGVGDLLPAPPDDARLVPAASLEGDDGVADWGETTWAMPGTEPEDLVPVPSAEPLADEPDDLNDAETEDRTGVAALAVAAGADGTTTESIEDRPPRARVLSAIGRDDTALRWYTSEHGPKTPLASAAPGLCSGCGFFVRLGGPLGRVFGVCANEYAPDDGRVVSLDHGCGAHSEGGARRPRSSRCGRSSTNSATTWWICPGSRWRRRSSSRSTTTRGTQPPAWERRSACRDRARFSRGTYQRPNRPRHSPTAHVQTHQRWPGGRSSRSTRTLISPIAQAAVMTAVTSWSLASSGGGAGRSFLLT